MEDMTEIYRVKEEDFQKLLDYKETVKRSGGAGCLTIKHDWDTGEYILIHGEKGWARSIMESSTQAATMVRGLEEYLAMEVSA